MFAIQLFMDKETRHGNRIIHGGDSKRVYVHTCAHACFARRARHAGDECPAVRSGKINVFSRESFSPSGLYTSTHIYTALFLRGAGELRRAVR